MAILALLALNAVVAGALFLAAPDGRFLGMSPEALQRGPFGSFVVPGAALLAMGALASLATLAVARRWHWAAVLVMLTGAGFLVFEAVQVYVIGPFWLQAVVVALALLAAVGALGLNARARRRTA